MKKIPWNNIRLALIMALVIFLYSFSLKRSESRKLKDVVIEFAENENFITREKVNKLLIQNYEDVKSIPKEKLDLNSVENRLDSDPMIKKAEVYATVDGKLKAVIQQRQPIGRVYDGASSYYVDYDGKQMPLSESYTARVPLVTGDLLQIEPKKLHHVLKYIADDEFLRKNIIGLEVRPTGGIRMLSRGYDYEIMFGRVVNVERKFNNYKAFLQNAVKDTLLAHYKTINLKFTQQVVCTKK
jgi:cell division protein FtsQ